jgi:XTP/dITP diphosphohydrolase
MNKLVIASGNRGKLRELSAMLAPLDYDVLPQSEFDVPDVEETGTTFVENAIIKARNAALHTGLPAVADDSGIEVDALNGAPGVYSARFSGATADDDSNNALLVEKLRDVPIDQRTARYRAVIVFMRHAEDPSPIICEGSWQGSIVLEPRGANGFGYDPHFWVAGHDCTSAELDPETKNRLSHRGQALRQLVERLQG